MPSAKLISNEHNIAHISVELDKSDVAQHYSQMYRENAKDLRLPGFRRGKVPNNIVRQRLGAGAIQQHMDGLLKDAALEYACSELGLTPRAGKLEWHNAPLPEEGGGIAYDVSVPVLPTVALPDFAAWEIDAPKLEVTEEMVVRYKQRLRERFTNLLPKDEPSAAGDALEISFTSKYENGEDSPFTYQGMLFKLGEEGNLPGWDEHLTGRRAGDKLEFDYTMPDNFADARLSGKPVKVALEVDKVHALELPELDETFIKERLRLDTLDEFDKMVRAQLQRETEMQHEQLKRDEALGRAAAELQAEITPDMVEREVDALVDENERIIRSNGSTLARYLEQKGQSMEDYRKGLENAALSRIRQFLAVHTLSTQQQFGVTSDDMRRYALRLMQSEGITPEQMSQLMQNRAFLNDATFEILRDKSVSYMVQQAKFNVSNAGSATAE
jgi:trigger factor